MEAQAAQRMIPQPRPGLPPRPAFRSGIPTAPLPDTHEDSAEPSTDAYAYMGTDIAESPVEQLEDKVKSLHAENMLLGRLLQESQARPSRSTLPRTCPRHNAAASRACVPPAHNIPCVGKAPTVPGAQQASVSAAGPARRALGQPPRAAAGARGAAAAASAALRAAAR